MFYIAFCTLSACTPLLERSSTDWFLTRAEMEDANHGMPSNYHVSTQDNTVEPLLDGSRVFERLYEVISNTSGSDSFIHATFWELNIDDISFIPTTDELRKKTRVRKVLLEAIKRNVTLRFLVSSNLKQNIDASSLCRTLNQHCEKPCCVVDSRHGSPYWGSNHEKMWIIKQGRKLIGFGGSMDLTTSRYDTPEHDQKSHDLLPVSMFRDFSWFGVMYEFRGGAVQDMEAVFWYRWNDDAPANQLHSWTLDETPKYPMLTETEVDAHNGSLPVQVVRTFACTAGKAGMYQQFAPHGDFSFAALWFKSLRQARDHIYVGDQFFFFIEATQALLDALHHVRFMIIVTNSGKIDTPLGVYYHGYHQKQRAALLEPIRKLPRHLQEKVHLFTLMRDTSSNENPSSDQIYDHEKTLLIDDEFALVGSSGVDISSFTNDADMQFGIFGKRWVKHLRMLMWAEHLEVDLAQVEDPDAGRQLWIDAAKNGTKRIRTHVIEDASPPYNIEENMFDIGYTRTFIDGRCPSERWPVNSSTLWSRVQDQEIQLHSKLNNSIKLHSKPNNSIKLHSAKQLDQHSKSESNS